MTLTAGDKGAAAVGGVGCYLFGLTVPLWTWFGAALFLGLVMGWFKAADLAATARAWSRD